MVTFGSPNPRQRPLLLIAACRVSAHSASCLPQHRDKQGAEQIEAAPPALPKPLAFDFLPGDQVDEERKAPRELIFRWQLKLLDLSVRNRLVNFRDIKQTLPFICPDVSNLVNQLADGKKFNAFAPKDEDPVGQPSSLPPATQSERSMTELNCRTRDLI